MRFQLLVVVTIAGLFAGSAPAETARAPISRVSSEEKTQGFSNRALLAKPRAAVKAHELRATEARDGLSIRRSFPRLGELRIIEPAAGESIPQAIARLRASGLYEYVEPDYVRHPHALPNDPRFVNGDQWFLRNTGQNGGIAGADIGAVAAWTTRTDASNVIVAIIDTGIRRTHEDIASVLWKNPGEIAGNGIDDDRNGYIDDVHGINSLAAAGSAASGNTDDDAGHGTMIAGIVAAAGNNGKGGTGVAWRAQIMALKFDDAEGSATVSNSIECIDYALAHGARIINISYGSAGFSQAEYDAIERARAAGAVVVTAAGNYSISNDFFPNYPSNYLIDNVVTVAATDRRDALSEFSNYSAGLVELGAPGTAIVSTSHEHDSAYTVQEGTSLSAPFVAGSLALLKAQFPTDDYRGLINRMLRTVDPLPALRDKVQTGGRLNLAKALVSTSNRPFNDDFATRATISGSAVTVRSHTQHASAETGEPAHAGLMPETTLWWSWTAPAAGTAVVETAGSNFDTVVAVYGGTSLAGLTSIAFNDDFANATTSRAAFAVVAGTTYQIAVGGKGGVTGPLLLTLGYQPVNDQFSNAIALSGQSMRITGFNTAASSETGEPKTSPAASGRTVWYKWTAPDSGHYSFSIFAYGFDAVGAVYTGSSVDALVQVETASKETYNEAARFETTAGTSYYFQIDSADRTAGFFALTLVDATPISGYYPFDSSPAFNPALGGYLAVADTQGLMAFINFVNFDVQTLELEGMLDVGSPAFDSSGSVYIGDEYGYLYAYNSNFVRRWSKALGQVRVASSPAIGADGTIYVHTDDGFVHGYFPGGALKWRALVPGESYSSPTLGSDGTIYIGSDDEHLYALSPTDGAIKWKFKADGEIYASPAIGSDGTLYFGTLNGKFYAVTAAGVERWSYTAGGSISSSAAIGPDGTLYFGCYDTCLHALTPEGTLRWKYATGDEIRASSPAIASDGVIYIGSYDGFVHAVTPAGVRKRVYATGAYIRSSPLIHYQSLIIGSGDTRLYFAYIGVDLADSPWPMHRQNVRRTGRRLSNTAPSFVLQPLSCTVMAGESTTLAVEVAGDESMLFQWFLDGSPISGATQSTYTLADAKPAQAGNYTVTVTNSRGVVASNAALVTVPQRKKVVGAGTEIGFDIYVATNRNTFDQVLLDGATATITADAGQITRISYVDVDDDIVQVEFSGAGTLTLALENPSGPASPVNYNQSTLYMKGRASIVITGADERTNVSVFSVGRLNAFDPTGTFNALLPISPANNPANNGSSLFQGRASTVYDGIADIAKIEISSRNGRFGGVRTANASYSATQGFTGISAPGVVFDGPVFIGDIDASGTATPGIVVGRATDTRITGGDLFQANGHSVEVNGLTKLQFTAGGDSHGKALAAQTNRAVLCNSSGANVTAQIVVNPVP